MTWIGCEETMGWLSRAFAEPAVQQQLRELRAARAEPGAYISALAEVAGDAQRDTLIAEFRQLPTFTVTAIIEAWAMADGASRQEGWHDDATARGVSASGWSWAGRFGDLDRDGYLDLYVVNGMIATDLFGYLPNGELVEENQVFHNQGDGSFVEAPAWQLGSTSSGRGMVMADLDGDGDLDIVVNNLRGFAQWFENRLCGGSSIEVNLRQPGMPNPYAVGAVVQLVTDRGVQRRDVRASGGYLSGDPQRLHFGLAGGTTAQQLEITWPDGAVSRISAPAVGTAVTITRE